MNLLSKVALVTGGLSGIGASCIEELLANNVKGVVVADINDDKTNFCNILKEKYGDSKVTYVKTDISNRDSFDNAFRKTIEQYENIDILINCAGIVDEINWEKTIQVHLVGTTYGCLLAINKYFPKYKSSDEACIINISSACGLVPTKVLPHYTSAKHGVIGLTRSLGSNRIITTQGIRTVVLCPAYTETPMSQGTLRIVYEELYAEELFPLKCQKPEAVAKGVVYILEKAESGSVWLMEEGILSKAELPSWENLEKILTRV